MPLLCLIHGPTDVQRQARPLPWTRGLPIKSLLLSCPLHSIYTIYSISFPSVAQILFFSLLLVFLHSFVRYQGT